MNVIKIKRGLLTNLAGATLQLGELAFTTDEKALYIFDGTNKVKIGKDGVLGGEDFTTSTSDIKMNGVVSVGVSPKIPRADHVHASDTSKANLASPTFTGTPSAPTPATSDNTTKIATTAFVKAQAYLDANSTIDGGTF